MIDSGTRTSATVLLALVMDLGVGPIGLRPGTGGDGSSAGAEAASADTRRGRPGEARAVRSRFCVAGVRPADRRTVERAVGRRVPGAERDRDEHHAAVVIVDR